MVGLEEKAHRMEHAEDRGWRLAAACCCFPTGTLPVIGEPLILMQKTRPWIPATGLRHHYVSEGCGVLTLCALPLSQADGSSSQTTPSLHSPAATFHQHFGDHESHVPKSLKNMLELCEHTANTRFDDLSLCQPKESAEGQPNQILPCASGNGTWEEHLYFFLQTRGSLFLLQVLSPNLPVEESLIALLYLS